jgi:carboxylate-amine ligase
MLQDGFRKRISPSLGVELELQIVDDGTLALQPGIDAILDGLPGGLEDSVKHEFHACCVEVSTSVCGSVGEVRRDLGVKLAGMADNAARRGLLLAWGGTHPFSHWRDQALTPDRRYRELADLYQETLLRQLTFGLHVHVGVESGDAAVRACDGIRGHLPVLLALSANSPFWCGRPTGFQSHRLEVMGSIPGGGIPPRLGDWDAYGRLIEHLTRCGQIKSPKDLWWDARPSPALGTLEVRIFDMPPGLESVLGLTALIQCLVHLLASPNAPGRREAQPAAPPTAEQEQARTLVLQQNRWLAARYGLDAPLIDCATGRKAPARVLARELIDRLMPIARELGCASDLQGLRIRIGGPSGADRQLMAYARGRSLADVVRQMTRAEPSADWFSAAPLPAGNGALLGMVAAGR